MDDSGRNYNNDEQGNQRIQPQTRSFNPGNQTTRRTRTILVEVPMETDYVDYPSANNFVHSNANYNAGTNGPSNTAYQSTPQSANVNPRVNFNERPRPQLLNNEPLYPSSLPPPENQQVIQPVSLFMRFYKRVYMED